MLLQIGNQFLVCLGWCDDIIAADAMEHKYTHTAAFFNLLNKGNQLFSGCIILQAIGRYAEQIEGA